MSEQDLAVIVDEVRGDAVPSRDTHMLISRAHALTLCAAVERLQVAHDTERTMHAAWRKRAEQAERDCALSRIAARELDRLATYDDGESVASLIGGPDRTAKHAAHGIRAANGWLNDAGDDAVKIADEIEALHQNANARLELLEETRADLNAARAEIERLQEQLAALRKSVKDVAMHGGSYAQALKGENLPSYSQLEADLNTARRVARELLHIAAEDNGSTWCAAMTAKHPWLGE